MTLPHFLIIGAMKAGTTSLYFDLMANPAVFFPQDKEPEALADDSVLTEAGRAAYAKLFAKAKPGQICGEASTGYTKLPDIRRVPQRARAVLGSDVRLIYLVREPIARIISHHHHELSAGAIDTADINEAVRTHPQFINWSRYAMQARAWLDVFPRENLRIVRFESYIKSRQETVRELSEFLGIQPRPDLIRSNEIYNPSQGKPVGGRATDLIRANVIYRRMIRPMLSPALRNRIRSAILPKAPPRPTPPTPETVEWIIDQFQDDLAQLQQLMGLDSPLWHMDTIREKYRV